MEAKSYLYHITFLIIFLSTSYTSATDYAELNDDLGKSQHFNLDKVRLRELWHIAMIRGLIKAKTRSYLTELPAIERILFQQCEQDAKNTVDLAQCSWKVIKQRRYVKETEGENKQKLVYYQTDDVKQQFLKKKKTKKIKKIAHKTYFKNGKQWNPIRPQIRRPHPGFRIARRPRRQTDPVAEAWELFLQEERQKMKKEINNFKKPEQTVKKAESIDRNFLGLPRVMQKSRIKREKSDFFFKSVFNDFLFGDMKKHFQKFLHKKTTPHLDKLHILKDHYDKVEEIRDYYKVMNNENKSFFKKVGIPIDSKEPELHDNVLTAVEDLLDVLNEFSGTKGFKTLSIMSPRLFPLFPEAIIQSKKKLLSPTLLSFHKEGFFSLPDVFSVLTSEQAYQQIMLDLLMDLSGAGKALDQVLSKMSHEMDYVSNVQYPLLMEMKQHDSNWLKARGTFSEDQRKEYDKFGYTYLDPEQMDLVYNNPKFTIDQPQNISAIAALNRSEKEKRIEEFIRELSELSYTGPDFPMNDIRKRRSAEATVVDENDLRTSTESSNSTTVESDEIHVTDNLKPITPINKPNGGGHPDPMIGKNPAGPTDEHAEAGADAGGHADSASSHGQKINGITFLNMHPAAFSNMVGHGIALEAVTLSPQAFIGEFLVAEGLNAIVLSPRAFVATVLSPSALIARILSPSALRAEVLAPRALTAWVLSPEAMIAEVLTPRFLEPRVLSPEALVIDILSPGILAPHVLSSESIGVMVLSPNILSPRIASEENLLVEVLSPHILGGPHNHEEKHTNIHDKESSGSSSKETGHDHHVGHHYGIVRSLA